MSLIKNIVNSLLYVIAVQVAFGFLQETLLEQATGTGYWALQILKYLILIIPIIVIVARALKINNLYNVCRLSVRSFKKNLVYLIVVGAAFFLIAINCYVGLNMINIFLTQYNTENPLILAIGYNVFDDPTTGIFAFILVALGIAKMYNKPLTGSER